MAGRLVGCWVGTTGGRDAGVGGMGVVVEGMGGSCLGTLGLEVVGTSLCCCWGWGVGRGSGTGLEYMKRAFAVLGLA